MKKNGRRLTALTLALALALGVGQMAFASWALGSELVARTTQLAEGTSLTIQSLWSASKSDLRTEHYITYDPTSGVKPMVFSGNYVASTNSVASAAAQLEAQGCRVVAAVNGGFFNTDGTIVGMLVTDGVVRSLDVENYTMLGFTADGQVFIDESTVSKKVGWKLEGGGDFTAALAGYNAYRHAAYANEAFLYNQDFSSRVSTTVQNVSAILRPLDGGVMKMNGSLSLEVVSVADTAQEGVDFNGAIPEGCYMLYAEYHDGNEWLTNGVRNLVPGQQVTVSVGGVSRQWDDAAYGVSGLYTLLWEGEIVPNLPAAANPYTAVGIKEDGTAVFYTIDGRQSGYSIGATYTQVAQRLQELGCVSAVALDGGGSTNLGATLPGTTEFAIQNKPSQTGRRVNNSILLVTDDPGAVGMAPGAYVDGKTQVVLTGAKLPMTATAYDGAGLPAPEQPLSWTATGGSIAPGQGGAAVYTAGKEAGLYSISASSGQGAMPVRVVDTLSRLRVTKEGSATAVSSLALKPGETVDLTATGTWWNLPVAMDDSDVTWRADAEVGIIDGSGRFMATSNQAGASGVVTASAGGRTVTIQVTVERIYPFTDIANHWSADYVKQLYDMGITNGYSQPDGTALFKPNGKLTRGELLTFITRLLNVDTGKYENVTLPFADAGSIASWQKPYVKAMYALGVLDGSSKGGKLYANVNDNVSREAAMTMLGRILATQVKCDLSGFSDSGSVSGWALPYVQTLVARKIVQGSGGKLNPKADITRGEVAKLLVEINSLDKATLTPRPETPAPTPEPTPEPTPVVDIDGPIVSPVPRPTPPGGN